MSNCCGRSPDRIRLERHINQDEVTAGTVESFSHFAPYGYRILSAGYRVGEDVRVLGSRPGPSYIATTGNLHDPYEGDAQDFWEWTWKWEGQEGGSVSFYLLCERSDAITLYGPRNATGR